MVDGDVYSNILYVYVAFVHVDLRVDSVWACELCDHVGFIQAVSIVVFVEQTAEEDDRSQSAIDRSEQSNRDETYDSECGP